MAVDGVTEVFPARNLWQRLPGRAASLLQRNAADAPPLVEVREESGRAEATVRIGVSPDARTPDVVRAVAAAVRNHLAPEKVAVQVTVVRIAAGDPPAASQED
nr:hypothetical protein [Pseudarthrobacter sp. C4D7]